jgi:hypothetical protein
MTNPAELEKRVDELERRVRDLEARPVFVPQYVPVPIQPYAPLPMYPSPWQSPWVVTCQGGSAVGADIPGAYLT